MNYYRDCSSSSSRNTNKARGRQWNRFTAPGTPSGIDLDAVDGNRSQSGTPHGKSHSERELSGNNLTSAGTPPGNNLPNGSPMLGDPTSVKIKITDIETGRTRKRTTNSRPHLGTFLQLVDGTRSQNGTPHVISHCVSETNGNNLTSAGTPSGNNLPNGSPTRNPTSASTTATDNAPWTRKQWYTSNEQTCSSSSRINNNKGVRSWNCPTDSGTPPGTHLDWIGGNQSQSGTPHGKSHSEREPSGNNLTLAGTPHGNNLPNGSPMLGDPPSKKLKVGKSNSQRELSGNNLTSAGTPPGNNLPNGSPMLGDPPIKKT